jgi:hypothetical protein
MEVRALRQKYFSSAGQTCKLSAPMFGKMYASFAGSESQSANDNFFAAD